MKNLNKLGLDLCAFQGRIFELATRRAKESSLLFVRRFMKSDIARSLDNLAIVEGLDESAALTSLEKQFKDVDKGKKYSPNAMYWVGYMYRYICYTRQISSRLVYEWFKPSLLLSLYESHHTQSEEYTIASLTELTHLDPNLFDLHYRFKANLQKRMTAR